MAFFRTIHFALEVPRTSAQRRTPLELATAQYHTATMAPLAEASAPPAPALEPATVLKQKLVEEEPQGEAPCDEDNNDDSAVAETAKPQTDDVAAETEAAAADAQRPTTKRVRFDVADVVEFEPTMWTATVSSEGVPVSPLCVK